MKDFVYEEITMSINSIMDLLETANCFSSKTRKAVGLLVNLYIHKYHILVNEPGDLNKNDLEEFINNHLPQEYSDLVSDLKVISEMKDKTISAQVSFLEKNPEEFSEPTRVAIDFKIIT